MIIHSNFLQVGERLLNLNNVLSIRFFNNEDRVVVAFGGSDYFTFSGSEACVLRDWARAQGHEIAKVTRS